MLHDRGGNFGLGQYEGPTLKVDFIILDLLYRKGSVRCKL